MAKIVSRRAAMGWIFMGSAAFALGPSVIALAVPSEGLGATQSLRRGDRQALMEQLEADGIDLALFVTLWKAAFLEPLVVSRPSNHKIKNTNSDQSVLLQHRESAFVDGFVSLLQGSTKGLKEELALFSTAISYLPGRLLLLGTWKQPSQLPPHELAASLDSMAASPFAFRRQAVMGLLIILGMSHYGSPVLAADSGYPGPPALVAGLWSNAGLGDKGRSP